MTDAIADYAAWIGRSEITDDELALAPALAAAATLDDTTTRFAKGSPLPPLVALVLLSSSGSAGAARCRRAPTAWRLHAADPLSAPDVCRCAHALPPAAGHRAAGAARSRDSHIRLKSGRSGSLAFVSVLCRFYQDGVLCIEEEQDIVYREPGPAACLPARDRLAAAPGRSVVTNRDAGPEDSCFRFSALTFNAHRIHYDRPYAVNEEGYPGLVVHGPLDRGPADGTGARRMSRRRVAGVQLPRPGAAFRPGAVSPGMHRQRRSAGTRSPGARWCGGDERQRRAHAIVVVLRSGLRCMVAARR
jgi:3-methylfumaryl-CoA hydratase